MIGDVGIVTLMSLLSEPSIVKLLLRARCPLAEIPVEPGKDGERSAKLLTFLAPPKGRSTFFIFLSSVSVARSLADEHTRCK